MLQQVAFRNPKFLPGLGIGTGLPTTIRIGSSNFWKGLCTNQHSTSANVLIDVPHQPLYKGKMRQEQSPRSIGHDPGNAYGSGSAVQAVHVQCSPTKVHHIVQVRCGSPNARCNQDRRPKRNLLCLNLSKSCQMGTHIYSRPSRFSIRSWQLSLAKYVNRDDPGFPRPG